MRRKWMKWLPGLLAAALLVVIATGIRNSGPPTGKQASSFSLTDVNQRQLSFPGNWHDKKVALVFFSAG